jgi:hypothetical protein
VEPLLVAAGAATDRHLAWSGLVADHVRIEAAVLHTRPEIAAADLPDQVAAAVEMIGSEVASPVSWAKLPAAAPG